MQYRDIFSNIVSNALGTFDNYLLQEIRVRVNSAYSVKVNSSWKYLSTKGLTTNYKEALVCHQKDIDDILYIACKKSVYAYNEQIINGYLTLDDGTRIGVCGQTVYDNEAVVGFTNVSSLCVRIPHLIKGCSTNINKYCFEPLANTLLIGAPSSGKTTLLRDLILSNSLYQTVVVDERREILPLSLIDNAMESLINIDIMSCCAKKYAFTMAIKCLAPQLIVTDELLLEDFPLINFAVSSGVKFFATLHADSLDNALLRLQNYSTYIERYIILNDKISGKVDKVYNRNKEVICELF